MLIYLCALQLVLMGFTDFVARVYLCVALIIYYPLSNGNWANL